ncbi:hypothetical protein G3554_02795 [Micromonospora sp. PPF5-17]|uniref:Uncharacterized protein n=2 Tax=Micromonosporaceae TaxID=28056 RepID=A0ABX9WLK4_9ACTN|nr:hypothetical protein [Micromonospora sp. PPF5-17B]NES35102.1 hypothetical protein [Micromonospora solifontis]NES57717.1 hypothetical protein [Micromonospora sp. PPF5-6]RNM01389.1 hypothetical protein EFE23_02805 [Micromonospora solifontis]
MMEGLNERLRAARFLVNRISPVPLLVRVGIFVTVLVGFLVAYPVEAFVPRSLLALTVVAVLPAVGPRRVWPTFAALVTVGGWLLATVGFDRPPALWRLVAVASLLYLAHTLCALAALLPYDAVVDPDLAVRWLSRAGGVVLASAVLGIVLGWLGGAGGDRGSQAATVAGLLVAVGLSALLGWLLRRR